MWNHNVKIKIDKIINTKNNMNNEIFENDKKYDLINLEQQFEITNKIKNESLFPRNMQKGLYNDTGMNSLKEKKLKDQNDLLHLKKLKKITLTNIKFKTIFGSYFYQILFNLNCVINFITLCLNVPIETQKSKILFYTIIFFDIVCVLFFTLDAILRIIYGSFGFGDFSFKKDIWNLYTFIINFFTLLSIIMQVFYNYLKLKYLLILDFRSVSNSS